MGSMPFQRMVVLGDSISYGMSPFALRAGTGRCASRRTPGRRSAVVTALCLKLGPGVLERERPVEHRTAGPRIGIDAEVAQPLELDGLARAGLSERRLQLAV